MWKMGRHRAPPFVCIKLTRALFEVSLRRSWKPSTHGCHKGSWGIGNRLWWQTYEHVLTFCRPSRTVCRFLFRISSLDSYFILRSGTTAIRLKRMSWYGSLKNEVQQQLENEAWEFDCVHGESEISPFQQDWTCTHPAVARPILSMITRRALSVHSSSSPQGPKTYVTTLKMHLFLNSSSIYLCSNLNQQINKLNIHTSLNLTANMF